KRRTVFLVGISGQVRTRLERLGLLQQLQPHQHGLTRLEALQQAVDLIDLQSDLVSFEVNEEQRVESRE
ncbi:MAG: hypothetical protein AAGC54_09470, partial [Cyanobacteria bacterium P01_F01_bin.4]